MLSQHFVVSKKINLTGRSFQHEFDNFTFVPVLSTEALSIDPEVLVPQFSDSLWSH